MVQPHETGVLGSFEELVLLSVLRHGDDAYAVPIRRDLAVRTGSDVTMGAVYATLDRLLDKGARGHPTGAPRRLPGRPAPPL